MFASFKRSSVAAPGNTTGTEKDPTADLHYADLEKRADGRWKVHSRPHLKATGGGATSIDGKAPTCCGFLPARAGVLFFTGLALGISGVSLGVTATTILQNGRSMRHVDFLVTATSLSLCTFLFVTCLLGLYATWRARLKPFTVFWFAFFCHWVLDLASTIAFLVVAYQRDVTNPSSSPCLERGLEPGCKVPVNLLLVLVTVGWCLFKIITAYALYVMYKYRRTLLSRSQPSSTKSSPKSPSPSTPTRLSPFSRFKPKFKAFPRSPRQGRPWPPTDIPTIKVDLASDQSSASSYSNSSSGPGSAGFAVFEFAAKYPSLRTVPLEPIGENLKAALERQKNKGEEKESDSDGEVEADLGLVKGRSASWRAETIELPTLLKHSVVGSDPY